MLCYVSFVIIAVMLFTVSVHSKSWLANFRVSAMHLLHNLECAVIVYY